MLREQVGALLAQVAELHAWLAKNSRNSSKRLAQATESEARLAGKVDGAAA